MQTDIITLYHGTTYDFVTVDITKGKPNKDFGQGFYTSRDIHHAQRLAIRNREIESERSTLRGRTANITAWLYSYEFDLRELDKLNVKDFATPDREWIKFVVLNRMSRTPQHNYDVVIGATANDNTRASIQAVLSAANGQALTDKAIDALIALVEPNNLPRQYFFGTQHAADLLQYKGRRVLK